MHEQVLVVDDAYDTVELLRYNLKKANYEPLIARNGKEAIEALRTCTPDLVLLDVMMPELNGWEVCRILRANAKVKSIPIIMITALFDEEARVKGLSLGSDDYITKPFSIRELLLKIHKHLERHQAIRQLQAKEQEKEISLRYFIHEMGNSLNVISGFSSLALKKDCIQDDLKKINSTAMHAESLLKDASLLSQLEKDRCLLPIEPIDIVALTKEVADMFYDKALKKEIEIVIMHDKELTARANKNAARQVLVNLLSNAVKYNRMRGKIWISFGLFKEDITVIIRDEGCGIPQDELPRIFDKFYRATGSALIKGAGLGLYIVKLLTESMGGKIAVTSDKGAGSTFTVSFLQANTAMQCSTREVA